MIWMNKNTFANSVHENICTLCRRMFCEHVKHLVDLEQGFGVQQGL